MRKQVTVLFLSAILTHSFLISCSRQKSNDSTPSAITNRPQSFDQFIAVAKLTQPALLTTATRKDGTNVISEDALKALNAEQEQFIAEIQKLSSEIKIIYRYKLVLNGVAILAPKALEAKFRQLSGVALIEGNSSFARPQMIAASAGEQGDISKHNSVSFIGADRVHKELGLTGQNIRVGVLDTGIDFTHAMFGGAGTAEAYKAIDPAAAAEGQYPSKKVVGGIDLVGTEYDSASPKFAQHIPKPDNNPIDEGGHGTHVAGTIAGLGDGVRTYSGVAPDASLFAIKVFGKDGSTSDAVVIAGLEYSADPNGDLSLDDQLYVVNLSLGSPYGNPHLLYSEAMRNLVNAGTFAAISAGNSGHHAHIVGAPSTTPEALSVAASIDSMEHNWKFRAVKFLVDGTEIITEAIEASFSKPISEAGAVSGKLVYIGLADKDLTDADKAALAGNVALIDRGRVSFNEKGLRAAKAGAIGIVVANNIEGDPFIMGGEEKIEIPAMMVTQTLGNRFKEAMAKGEVTIDFQTDQKVEKPQLIDTLTGFSSRGPRSLDALIKPEISAPGANVISAEMGAGDKGIKFSGTSMAAPHIAGVAALLKQGRPELSPADLKSVMMNSAKKISDASSKLYPVAQQGAGRVETLAAATTKLVVEEQSLSLGIITAESRKTLVRSLVLRNIGQEKLELTITAQTHAALGMRLPASVSLEPGERKALTIHVDVDANVSKEAVTEADGNVIISQGEAVVAQVPVLALIKRNSRVVATKFSVAASSASDAAGAETTLTLRNNSRNEGEALAFSLIAQDDRKLGGSDFTKNITCDVQSAGARVIRDSDEGKDVEMLEIAVKLYNPVTSWHLCELSIQIDGNGDGIADQELLGTHLETLTGNAAHAQAFVSALTDANQMRAIRSKYETTFEPGKSASPDYSAAILSQAEFKFYPNSTIAIVRAELSMLARAADGALHVKVAALNQDTTAPQADDYVGKMENQWKSITPSDAGLGFSHLPASISLAGGTEQTVTFTKGLGKQPLVVYLPHNTATDSRAFRDEQQLILSPKYSGN